MSFELRPGEVVADALPPEQAGLLFIGRIHTPWTERSACPRQGRADGPLCRTEIFETPRDGHDAARVATTSRFVERVGPAARRA